MRLNDQIYGTNGNSRIPSDLKDEIRNAEKKIKDSDNKLDSSCWPQIFSGENSQRDLSHASSAFLSAGARDNVGGK